MPRKASDTSGTLENDVPRDTRWETCCLIVPCMHVPIDSCLPRLPDVAPWHVGQNLLRRPWQTSHLPTLQHPLSELSPCFAQMWRYLNDVALRCSDRSAPLTPSVLRPDYPATNPYFQDPRMLGWPAGSSRFRSSCVEQVCDMSAEALEYIGRCNVLGTNTLARRTCV